MGWSTGFIATPDTIRKERFAKQKKLGIFPADMKLPPLPDHVPAWDSLDENSQQMESFRMAIFAAMVDRVDQNIGRLIKYLKKKNSPYHDIKFGEKQIVIRSKRSSCGEVIVKLKRSVYNVSFLIKRLKKPTFISAGKPAYEYFELSKENIENFI